MIARPLLLSAALVLVATSAPAEEAYFSASGTHRCSTGQVCLVAGVYPNCLKAVEDLRSHDCCPVTWRSKSADFFVNYCIAAASR